MDSRLPEYTLCFKNKQTQTSILKDTHQLEISLSNIKQKIILMQEREVTLKK